MNETPALGRFQVGKETIFRGEYVTPIAQDCADRFGTWTIRFIPSRDRYGHQCGGRLEFDTKAERDAAFTQYQ